MPKYISEIINQINYRSNFGYTLGQLPNPAAENDADANKTYSINIRNHIKNVVNCWFVDTGIEQLDGVTYRRGYYPSDIHTSPRSLRQIAEQEFNTDSKVLVDVDRIIEIHDRSRYSDDEFYGVAIDDNYATKVSQLKHFQRNAHEFSHYCYYSESSGLITCDMPEVFVWIKIASWLANYHDSEYKFNVNYHKNPFQQFWGRDYKEVFDYYDEDDNPVYHCEGPYLPQTIPMSSVTISRIGSIVDRWELPCPFVSGEGSCPLP